MGEKTCNDCIHDLPLSFSEWLTWVEGGKITCDTCNNMDKYECIKEE